MKTHSRTSVTGTASFGVISISPRLRFTYLVSWKPRPVACNQVCMACLCLPDPVLVKGKSSLAGAASSRYRTLSLVGPLVGPQGKERAAMPVLRATLEFSSSG